MAILDGVLHLAEAIGLTFLFVYALAWISGCWNDDNDGYKP